MTFQEAAIKSAQSYYDFLSNEGLGAVTVKVRKIEDKGSDFLLTLDGKLFNLDACVVKINNISYSQDQIKLSEPDNKRRTVLACPKTNDGRKLLKNSPTAAVCIASDLRFLVQRVEDWYKQYGKLIHIPIASPHVESFSLYGQPSEDQRVAVNGIVSEPFTYVWGAPGTGKTRFVLANCVLMYLRAGRRILITAPTNNAVDQMLYGILSVLEEVGAPLDDILRLGIADAEFTKRYPSLCEDTALAKFFSEMSDQLSATKSRLMETEEELKLLHEYDSYKAFFDSLIACSERLDPLFSKLTQLFRQHRRSSKELAYQEGKILSATAILTQSIDANRKASESVTELCGKVNKSGLRLGRKLLQWRNKKRLEKLKQEIYLNDKSIAEQNEIILKAERETDICSVQIETLRNEIDICKSEIYALTTFYEELYSTVKAITTPNELNQSRIIVNSLLNKKREELLGKQKMYESKTEVSEAELLQRKRELMLEIEQLQAEREATEMRLTGRKLNDYRILAATVDTCLNRMLPDGDYKPEHIFLDEAGYCSLIKGVALMAFDCPVTFLGDHMQLPPVCEMGDSDLKSEQNKAITLWAQSALYVEDALSKQPEAVFEDYFSHIPPLFKRMKKYDLLHTYRFGEKLAQILADEVYAKNFDSSADIDTDIFVLSAPRNSTDFEQNKRENHSECQAIALYLQSNSERDVGIITPYKDQRDLLRKKLMINNDLNDSIMTVHGSQGREWDTVLLSVVDTTDKWFTNSLILRSNGLKVINTAVSRAKKKLIIVCDDSYWEKQERQLIGKLVSAAKRL